MSNKFETIGIIKWYDGEKGFGVLENTHDHREYFIHKSRLSGNVKIYPSQGDVVLFCPDIDKKRNREIANNVHYIRKKDDIEKVINTSFNDSFFSDDILEKIFMLYLSCNCGKDDNIIDDSFNRLLGIIISFMSRGGEYVKLYPLLRHSISNAFNTPKAVQFLEYTDIRLTDELPSDLISLIINNTASAYVLFYIAFKNNNYTEPCVSKATSIKRASVEILNELCRFVKKVNTQEIINEIEKEKSKILNKDYILGLNGKEIVSSINQYVFSDQKLSELNLLYKAGYISDIDNLGIKDTYPKYYKSLKIISFKEKRADVIDIDFIRNNIMEFDVSDLVAIKTKYNLSEDNSILLFLPKAKELILKGDECDYKDIITLGIEIPKSPNWIMDNRVYLSDSSIDKYNNFKIWLYKNNLNIIVEEDFVAYFIDKFSKEELINIVRKEGVNPEQIKKILKATFIKQLKETNQHDSCGYFWEKSILDLKDIVTLAEEILTGHFASWIEAVYVDLEEKDQYILWKENVISIYPSSYIREHLLTSTEEGYIEFYQLFQCHKISDITACEELWDVLLGHQEITNRPIFYKILYCIKYLIKVNGSYKEAIEQKKNDYYNLILWYLSYSDSFDFNLLCRLFIYFAPNDQVRIIKAIFYMANKGNLNLTIEMLESIVRVDSDLYSIISKEHPLIPIDVSTDIVIKALANLYRKGNFSSDKDVLNIIIKASQYTKKERIKIGSYFDICPGRLSYKRDKAKTVLGKISMLNSEMYAVNVVTSITVQAYSQYYGRYEKNTNNPEFQNIVNAIKKLPGSKWNPTDRIWEVPINNKEELFKIAKQFGLIIEGQWNYHMFSYKSEETGRPSGIDFCEGRQSIIPSKITDTSFLWCRNQDCHHKAVAYHDSENWESYTLLDFCRILGLNTDSKDQKDRIVEYGKYLSFSSIINRANTILDHLYCRECGDMLEPVEVSDYYAHLVTKFHCTNPKCSKFHESIYISKCFNWKCHGVIDERDDKKCPNSWVICPVCGSCCSNRIIEQRINNRIRLGLGPAPYLEDFVRMKKGHLEKDEFYCYKCGGIMRNSGDRIFTCPTCGVVYNRKPYDYEVKYTYSNNYYDDFDDIF